MQVKARPDGVHHALFDRCQGLPGAQDILAQMDIRIIESPEAELIDITIKGRPVDVRGMLTAEHHPIQDMPQV